MPAPTLDLAPVRAAIAAKVAGVASVGIVHAYERYAKGASDLLALYKSAAQDGDRLLGWFVRQGAFAEVFVDTGRWVRDVDWEIVGYMSLDDADATEKKLSVLVDAIADAFRDDDDLGGTVATCIIDNRGDQAGIQLREFGPVLFAGVLCHRARLGVTTRIFI